jgi:hypothetical protein
MKVEAKITPVPLSPVQQTGEQPSTGKERKFGNIPGSQFYNALRYKKSKGKNKVKGTRKRPTIPYDKRKGEVKHVYDNVEEFTPQQWDDRKNAQKEKTLQNETQNKAQDK